MQPGVKKKQKKHGYYGAMHSAKILMWKIGLVRFVELVFGPVE